MNTTLTANNADSAKKQIRSILAWCFYDWGMSPYFSVITTFVFATYFTTKIAIDPILGTKQWGDAMGLAGLLVAILSPIFGSIADYSGHRKTWLFYFTYLGIIATSLLWYGYPSPAYVTETLTFVVIATLAFEIATVFYNSFLLNLAPQGYLGRISGWGWGSGYLGGIACLILVLTFFVNDNISWLPTENLENIRACGPLVGLWMLIFSLPLFLFLQDKPIKPLKSWAAIRLGLSQLKNTLLMLKFHRNIFLFLLARMIYTDGLNTLFAFGGIYAAGTFHMPLMEVVQFGIVLNITAGIGAALFAWLDDYIGSKTTVLLAVAGLILSGIGILCVHQKLYFWMLAPIIGLFVGPTQAASRTLMARLSPPEQITEMFGLFAFSGKATAFLGPWILAAVTYHFQSQRAGMATIFAFLLVGGILLCFVKEKAPI